MSVYGGFGQGYGGISVITYSPGLQDSGDLEAGTTSITATAEGATWADYDYTVNMTLPAPTDARLVLKRIAARLAVTLDSLSTGANLKCRVYVDVKDAAHRLFDLSWGASGAQLAAADFASSDADPTIFNALKDGAAHTFRFFFWKDVAGTGDTVLSVVNLWEGVGTSGTSGVVTMSLTHSGFATITYTANRQGSGTQYVVLGINTTSINNGRLETRSAAGSSQVGNEVGPKGPVLVNNLHFWQLGTVSTDINYITRTDLVLRSE